MAARSYTHLPSQTRRVTSHSKTVRPKKKKNHSSFSLWMVAKLRRLGHWMVFAVAICMAGAVLAWAGNKYLQDDKALVLKDIECQGQKQLSSEVLLSGLPVEFGQKLWSIPKDSILQTLRANPWVRSASIELKWPGKMVIQVEEQEPLAIMAVAGGDKPWVGLTQDGRWLPKVELTKGSWPILESSKYWTPSLRKALGKFLLVAKVKAPEVYQSISQVCPLGNGTVAIYTSDNSRVFQVSLTDDVVRTIYHWREFVRYTSSKLPVGSTVDLRVPGYAFVRASKGDV